MKKLKFNSTLNHKQNEYRPCEISVEKVVELGKNYFESLIKTGLRDDKLVSKYKELMYMEGSTAHCVLFVNSDTGDGLLVALIAADIYDIVCVRHPGTVCDDISHGHLLRDRRRPLYRISGLGGHIVQDHIGPGFEDIFLVQHTVRIERYAEIGLVKDERCVPVGVC